MQWFKLFQMFCKSQAECRRRIAAESDYSFAIPVVKRNKGILCSGVNKKKLNKYLPQEGQPEKQQLKLPATSLGSTDVNPGAPFTIPPGRGLTGQGRGRRKYSVS
jgi:hypothetical protein